MAITAHPGGITWVVPPPIKDKALPEPFREFRGDGEAGPVLIRRDKVTAIRQSTSSIFPPLTCVLVEGKWLFLTDEYQAVRDWVLG